MSKNESPWKAAAIMGLAGVDLAVCIVLGFFLGKWISHLAGGERMWIVAGVFTGLALGILNIVYFIKKYMEGQDG